MLLIPIFFSCDDPTQLGIELDDDDSKIDVEFVDILVPASNIYIDSFATFIAPFSHYSSQARTPNEVMFGNLTDSVYGQVTATPFIEFRMIGSNVFKLPEDTLTFSKAYISFRIDEIYAERVLLNEEISIYNALDTLHSNVVYLSSTSLNYDNSSPIGYKQFIFNPAVDTMINIPLDQAYGEGLFEKLKRASQNDEYEDSLFLGYYNYPALVFEPGANNQGLYVFNLDDVDDTTAVYVEMKGVLGATYYYKFYFAGQPRYTKIERDRAPGKLSDLLTEYEESQVPSSRVYINPMAGVFTKLDLQALIDFADTSENVIVNKAELRLKAAAPGLYEDVLSPIQFMLINENGRINGPGALSSSYAILARSAVIGNSGITAGYDKTTGLFSGDITPFAQSFLDARKSELDYPSTEAVVHTNAPITPNRASLIRSEIKLRLFYTRLK